jgi:hypothetical protein
MRTESRVVAITPVGEFVGKWYEAEDRGNPWNEKGAFQDGSTFNQTLNEMSYLHIEAGDGSHINLPGELVRNSGFVIEFREVSDFLENVD